MTFDNGQGIDLASRSVRIIGPDGAEQQLGYDLLVGADGSSSVVRSALAEEVRTWNLTLSLSLHLTILQT